MAFQVQLADAEKLFPEYTFISALTPSAQKAVFHVRDKSNHDLCLKIIAPTYEMSRLQREVMALQNIKHPNVASLKEYEFSTRPGRVRHYMVEEFIEGNDLTDTIQTGTPIGRLHAADLFAGICDGLQELFSQNIVHRDLKPSNIRVRKNGRPVIIDLGLARHLTLPDLTRTSEGAGIGTPIYFAPEQFQGTKHDIDHRTDIFSIGEMLYMSVIGTHPFYRDSMTYSELSDAVSCSKDYLSVCGFTALPSNWRILISRMLEKERVRRPQTAAQIANILRKIRGE